LLTAVLGSPHARYVKRLRPVLAEIHAHEARLGTLADADVQAQTAKFRARTAREPGESFILLLGADAARDLPRWREAEDVVRLAKVAVLTRPGHEAPVAPWVSAVVPVPALDLSATDLRRRAAAGRSLRYFVPDAVANFVAARGLYKDQ
ncbi:MAG TPA: hypothetical protein VF454_05485, partial [Gemmatimonadales bacterium]